MSNNEMMLGIHGTLHIVSDESAASTAGGHRVRIGIRKRYLLVLGLHHLSVQDVQTLYLLAQRCNLLIESRDLGLRYRFPLAIGGIKLREVARSEEHTSELQSHLNLVCRLLLEKKKN